jgi:hypothetical protein
MASALENALWGKIPNVVYGLIVCSGFYINEVFQTCAISVVAEITQSCPYQKATSLWKKKCSLKYLDSQFFSTVDIKRLKSNPTVVSKVMLIFVRQTVWHDQVLSYA